MATAGNRFALSALPKADKANAINEEIMIEKQTGEILVKSATGDISSYDAMARLRQHVDKVSQVAKNNALRADITLINFDNLDLSSVVNDNTNLMPSALTIKASNLKKFLISTDVETLELSASGNKIGLEPTVTIDIQFTVGSTNTNKTITGKLTQVNSIIQNAKNFLPVGTDLSTYSLKITSFKITKDTSYTNLSTIRHILHSVLVITE